MSIKESLNAVGIFATVFIVIYYGFTLFMGWWSIRVTIWFFTGGDFPLPWQPFG